MMFARQGCEAGDILQEAQGCSETWWILPRRAGGLEKQKIYLLSPTADNSFPIFPSDIFILTYLNTKNHKTKNCHKRTQNFPYQARFHSHTNIAAHSAAIASPPKTPPTVPGPRRSPPGSGHCCFTGTSRRPASGRQSSLALPCITEMSCVACSRW